MLNLLLFLHLLTWHCHSGVFVLVFGLLWALTYNVIGSNLIQKLINVWDDTWHWFIDHLLPYSLHDFLERRFRQSPL
jgi:hypothetical protein